MKFTTILIYPWSAETPDVAVILWPPFKDNVPLLLLSDSRFAA
jgi:hypothetical protein